MTERRDEDASATVELALLLPVYLMLFVGMLSIGHLVLIRQKVVEAVRFQAWLPDDAQAQRKASIDQGFFGTYLAWSGGVGFTQFSKNVGNVDFDNSFFTACYPNVQGASPGAKQLAILVLNDGAGQQRDVHLQWSHSEGSFRYAPDWLNTFIHVAASEPKTKCTVIVRARGTHERKVLHVEAQNPAAWELTDRNPIEDFANYTNNSPGFPISKESAQAHDRFYTPGAPDRDLQDERNKNLQPGNIPATSNGGDPGIWNQNFRLGGDVNAEHAFFHRMLYGN